MINKLLKLLSGFTLTTGKMSVCKCLVWLNQPKVPEKLLEMTKKNTME